MEKFEENIELLIKNNFSAISYQEAIKQVSYFCALNVAEAKSFLDLGLKNGTFINVNKSILLSGAKGYFVGKILGNAKGFAFLKVLGKDMDDLFLPPNALNGAMNGDIVLARLNKNNKNKSSDEARVEKIIKRAITRIVGKLICFKNISYVEAKSEKLSRDVKVENKHLNGAKNGEMVIVEIIDYGNNNIQPKGKIVERLKDKCEAEIDILSIIYEHELSLKFAPRVIEEARKFGDEIPKDDIKNRKDLTKEIIFTIDGEDAKDFDDAVCIKKTASGYKLGVHIADVSHYVKEGSIIDKEAFNRATSVYFPSLVLPMLPEQLSNGLCSLKEGVNRLCKSIDIELDNDANVISYNIYESIICSKARLTYTFVQNVLDGDENAIKEKPELNESFYIMNELSKKLIVKRFDRGALDLDISEPEIVLSESLDVLSVKPRKRNDAHKLIESFMLLANECVAEFVCTKKEPFPFVYRVHERPSAEKMTGFMELIKTQSIPHKFSPAKVTPKDLQNVITEIEGKDYKETIMEMLLRSLQKAKYLPNCLGHFGIAAKYYCHFTSPIRRYPDLAIHRILGKYINGELVNQNGHYKKQEIEKLKQFAYEVSMQSSERERAAEMSEREVDSYYCAKYMLKFVGEKFEGMVSGVTSNGIYVRLDSTIEGMVKIDDLPEDNYKFDDKNYCLKGTKLKYSLGDKIEITVKGADLISRRISFKINKSN